MDLLAFDAAQVGASGAMVTAVMAIVTGATAIRSLRRLTMDSRDRTRPVVVADLRARIVSHGITEFSVSNVGASVARNVAVSFSPPVPHQDENELGREPFGNFIRDRYSRPIPTLAPGHSLNNVYSNLADSGEDREIEESVPRQFSVTVAYEDERGDEYSETYELSIDVIMYETMTYPGDTEPTELQGRVARALELIANGVGKI